MMAIPANTGDRSKDAFDQDASDQRTNRRVTVRSIDPSITIPVSSGSRTFVVNVYYQHSTPVTTLAYTQIVASTSDIINNLQIFDSSGQLLVLAVGAVGLEVDKLLIFPGGNGSVDLTIPSGSRISLKAITADTTTGSYFAMTGIK